MNQLNNAPQQRRRIARPAVGIAIALLAAMAALAWAAPFRAPKVDGVITAGPADWASSDLVVNDIADDDPVRTANVRRMWLTWSADSLYVGVTYQDIGTNEALSVYLDTDRGVGPASAAELDSLPGNFTLPAGHRFEFVLGRPALDQFPGSPPRAFRVANDAGAVTPVSASIARAQAFNTGTALAQDADEGEGDKRFAFWLNAEFGIPWEQVYPGLNGNVPPYAVIKAVALIGRADPTANGIDSAPNNAGLDGGAGAVLLQNLHASVVDADGDGAPDPSDATISGTVTLPNDDGTAPVTVRAELIGFAGREPGAALSTVTTAAGVRAWTLPRLAAGRYRVTTSAEGYLTTSTEVDVAQSGAVTGVDQTLAKATAIGGTVGFASGPGAAVTLRLLGAGNEVLATRSLTAAGGAYTFYVEQGGDYVIEAGAATYLTATYPVSVTTGQDAVLDIELVRQTEISGVVTLLGGPGRPGTVTLLDSAGGTVGLQGFASGGGSFQFFTAVGGEFTVRAVTQPAIYVARDTTFTVTLGQDVTGLQIALPLAARVRGAIAFEGPDAPGRWELRDDVSGAWRDSSGFDAAGDTFGFYLEPGRFRLDLTGRGYEDRRVVFNVSENDTSLGDLLLTAVRATRLEIVDDNGRRLPEARATSYNRDAGDPWTSSRVLLAARDAAGRDDLYDLDGRLDGFNMYATKLDDASPPRGDYTFYASADSSDTISTLSFQDARARFWISNTAVEVLRVRVDRTLDPNAKAALDTTRLIVAFEDPLPRTVLLTADRDTLTADGGDAVVVRAELFDSAGNPSLLSNGDQVAFSVVPTSSGGGQFQTAGAVTTAGVAEAVLTATRAGTLDLTATVVIENRTLDVRAGTLDSGLETLKLTAVAGPTAGWDVIVPGGLGGLGAPLPVQARLIDALGNPTTEAGVQVTFSVDPPNMGTFQPATAATDAEGRATSEFTPSGRAGLLTIRAEGSGLAGDAAELQLRDVAVISDAAWQDEPPNRQTFDTTDLTALVVDNTADALLLSIPFASDWNGLQLHVIFETDNDAAGASRDPFDQPVNYAHAQKPDYALTSKYSANDYGDFRKWNKTAGRWEFWDLDNGVYGDPVSNQNIQGPWIDKLGDRVDIRVPFAVFGTRPASLRMELYLTQDDGEKRAAFDSAPQDSTLNLTFDYDDPQPGDWATALGPVTLEAWGQAYTVKTDFPMPPTVTEAAASPAAPVAGDLLTLTARVADAGDGVGDVLADLSAMGGGALVRMYDDGPAGGHGDVAAGDGQYTVRAVVPTGNPGGEQDLVIRAYDAGNAVATAVVVTVDVTAVVVPILQVADAIGDDHGPNRPGSAKKFITYPTNSAFVAGGFDITGLTIYETTQTVGGAPVEMLAFQVGIGDFPDPADPGTADWNPLYGQMNIEKIDIVIDSGPGGATASLPARQAAFLPHDAWDYAIILDGWYKAVVPSRGQNTLDSWRENALRTDRDIMIVGDPDANTVTAFVAKAALGDPDSTAIRKWDIAVLMSSHDFGGEEVLGGIRWVNESRSEWNFGGGDNSDRDANLIDLLLIPGRGHAPGQTQEELLDYESATALARLEQGLTGVALEMSAFEDTGPPVIDTGSGGSVVTVIDPLADAPVAVAVTITDDNRVARAQFRYRSTETAGGAWDAEVPMGFLGRDLWVVDILPSYLESLAASPIDGTRYLEFEIKAWDALDKEAISPVTTLQINPAAECRPADSALDVADLGLLQVDGSGLSVPDALRGNIIDRHVAQAWTGGAVSPDTMGSRIALQWDVCTVPEEIRAAPAVPTGRPLGVFREVFLATEDELGGRLEWDGILPGTLELSLHFPDAWAAGLNKDSIALYEYHAGGNRWVLKGGNVNPTGNNVTTTLDRTGIYGLFATEAVRSDSGEILSGITISPNPFSPNGDGLYDETNISFYLTQEATVTVEIYNIMGEGKRILAETFSYAGDDLGDPVPRRVPGLIWDGRDQNGEVVPYGVYVMRVIATYNQAGGTRTIRSNHSVAVIK